jgi:hypothetical protein
MTKFVVMRVSLSVYFALNRRSPSNCFATGSSCNTSNRLIAAFFVRCANSALESVRDLNTSESRRSKFTEMAMQKLLDNHLSAKYSHVGQLGKKSFE